MAAAGPPTAAGGTGGKRGVETGEGLADRRHTTNVGRDLREGPELKGYGSQRRSLELIEGLAYRRWRTPGLGNDMVQIVGPFASSISEMLRPCDGCESISIGPAAVVTWNCMSTVATPAWHRKGMARLHTPPCRGTWSGPLLREWGWMS